MHLSDIHKKQLQQSTVPPGYSIVELGPIQAGDIRWNVWNDCWNVNEPVESPKHDLIIGNPVTITHGICRQLVQSKTA